jgi:hypothetical protein
MICLMETERLTGRGCKQVPETLALAKTALKARDHNGRPSFPIPVWNGILDHKRNMGPALWVFLWCLDRITKEELDVGLVLGASVVTTARIAHELKDSERTIRRHLERLARHGYIRLKRTPYGFVITVAKSRKFNIWRSVKNGHPDRPNLTVRSGNSAAQKDTNVRSNNEDPAVDAAQRHIIPPYPPLGSLTARQRKDLAKELDRIYAGSVGRSKDAEFEVEAIEKACVRLVIPFDQAQKAIAESFAPPANKKFGEAR